MANNKIIQRFIHHDQLNYLELFTSFSTCKEPFAVVPNYLSISQDAPSNLPYLKDFDVISLDHNMVVDSPSGIHYSLTTSSIYYDHSKSFITNISYCDYFFGNYIPCLPIYSIMGNVERYKIEITINTNQGIKKYHQIIDEKGNSLRLFKIIENGFQMNIYYFVRVIEMKSSKISMIDNLNSYYNIKVYRNSIDRRLSLDITQILMCFKELNNVS